MRACLRNPNLSGAVAALVLYGGVVLGLTPFLLGALHQGYQREIERVLDAFEMPLAAALAKGDDVARIDELRRLETLPGIISALATPERPSQTNHARELHWQGRAVGWLRVDMSSSTWRRLRYRLFERLWIIGLVLGLVGGGVGGWIRRQQGLHWLRLRRLRKKIKARHQAALQRVKFSLEKECRRWTQHAMSFSEEGLILLDGSQRLVAFNPQAGSVFTLTQDSVKTHWLDLRRSSDWAHALKESIEHPGRRVVGPMSCSEYSTCVWTPEPNATWIRLIKA